MIGGNGSHWPGCWRVHEDCAVAKVEKLRIMCDQRERLIDDMEEEIHALLEFARRVHAAEDSPAWAHDAAAKLLELPSLAHGEDER